MLAFLKEAVTVQRTLYLPLTPLGALARTTSARWRNSWRTSSRPWR